jgi:hypothetical protein
MNGPSGTAPGLVRTQAAAAHTTPPAQAGGGGEGAAAAALPPAAVDWSTEPGAVPTTITRIEQVTPTIKLFTLRVDTGQHPHFTFKAGQ